jgi:hypothetical protein
VRGGREGRAGGWGKWGGGGATGTNTYAFITINMADLTDFRNILLNGFYLVSFALFQTFGNVNQTVRLKVLPMTQQV